MTTIKAAPDADADRAAAPEATASRTWARPDARRSLQLVLATFWLLDGLLQLQSYFFTKGFGLQMISGMSSGNPSVIARPIAWSGTAIGHHAVLTDSLFAVIQIAIGFLIAWRPTVKVGLAITIVWSAGVWWVGEGLGGVVNGGADPVNGAPGAVILYALAAVMLWPKDRVTARPVAFVAARWVGEPLAKTLWVLLWGSLAYFAVLGPNRSPRQLHDLLGGEASGEPRWLASVDHHVGSMVDHRGLLVSTILAILLVVVALGTFLPARWANASLVLAGGISLTIWVIGENFGGLLTNGATDLNSGPLLMLVAAAYWRRPPDPRTVHAALDRHLGLEAA